MNYDFKATELKWQQKWEEAKVFEAQDNSEKPKFYGLVEFPYPSGAGMHVGHIKAYSGLEVISRKRRMQGYNVLFPIGFDAYGLPTENYAIKTGIHPRKVTDMNIEKFSSQLKKVGFSFDWNRVVDTTEESYYKWTQWIFLKMFEKGLVFRDKTLVNYCPSCKVVLSNEDSQGGKCDICHSDIVQKSKDVWYLRITEYADKLLEGLEKVDYLPNIKLQQVNWIGKSTGAFVNFQLDGTDEKMKIYTTRPDTLFGVTFMVMAPEHPMLDKYKGMGKKKLYLIFGMCDESFSINCSQDIPESVDKSYFYFFVTLLNHLYWITGATLGSLIGGFIKFDTKVIVYFAFICYIKGNNGKEAEKCILIF